jgi:hypothetical protein
VPSDEAAQFVAIALVAALVASTLGGAGVGALGAAVGALGLL